MFRTVQYITSIIAAASMGDATKAGTPFKNGTNYYKQLDAQGNYGEAVINSSQYTNFTLARHGSNVFMAPLEKITGKDAYNTLPVEILKARGPEPNKIILNLAGKYLCDGNGKASACVDKAFSEWYIKPKSDGVHYKFVGKNSQKCLSVLKKDDAENRYLVGLEECNENAINQTFTISAVTSKKEKPLETK